MQDTCGPIYRWIQPCKKIILWKERITWALVWRTHTLWSELPAEIYRMIDVYMQETPRGDRFFGHSSLGI